MMKLATLVVLVYIVPLGGGVDYPGGVTSAPKNNLRVFSRSKHTHTRPGPSGG